MEVESLDTAALRELVCERRGAQSLRQSQTAEEVGVSFST